MKIQNQKKIFLVITHLDNNLKKKSKLQKDPVINRTNEKNILFPY